MSASSKLDPELRKQALKGIFSRKPKRLLRGNKYARLDTRVWSETELIESACEMRGMTLEQYIREAALRMARTDQTVGENRRNLRGKKAQGLPGAADKRLQSAMSKLVEQKRPVTPSALRTSASCTFRQAQAWLDKKTESQRK